jgi:hypothetical protein
MLIPISKMPLNLLAASEPFEVLIGGRAYIDVEAWEKSCGPKRFGVSWWIDRSISGSSPLRTLALNQ